MLLYAHSVCFFRAGTFVLSMLLTTPSVVIQWHTGANMRCSWSM